MAVIITATDFSPVADNAVHYACRLAQELGMQVIVTHAYVIPVAFHENPMPVISMEESKSLAEAQLDKLIDDLYKAYPQLGITPRLVYGDITDELKDCVAEHDTALVVVGNSSTDDSGFWLGSNLLSTLRHVQCPVAAIPETYSYKRVSRIAFACDMHQVAEKLPQEHLLRLVSATGAALHILNVDSKNKNFDPESPVEFTDLHHMLKDVNPVYHYIENEDIDAGIQSFVANNNIDWLVVMPHRHNFFEALFHKSHTKAIVQHAHVPLVSLHEKH